MLLDICGVDNLERKNPSTKRFECVYHLLDMVEHRRLRLRIPLDKGESLPSVTDIWKTADWFEREVWEMFGIEFIDKKKERLLTHKILSVIPCKKIIPTKAFKNFRLLSNYLLKNKTSPFATGSTSSRSIL